MTRPRQGRLVVLINSAVGVALIAVIASLSIGRHTVHPPALSEFAPAGGSSVHQPTASAAPPASPAPVRSSAVRLAVPSGAVGVPSQIACYGWPDGSTTQTFDPQSPPCVAGWAANRGNGGATATGVSGTTIRIGVPHTALPAAQTYAAFFNSHFQLYGRELQPVDLGAPDLSSDTGQQAAAAAAAQQQLFAALVQPTTGAGPAIAPTQFLDDAAGSHLVSVLAVPSQLSSTSLSALAPYAWSYAAGLDQQQQALGSLSCQLLAGRRASFSKTQSGTSRRFGILVPDAAHAGGSDLDISTLTSALGDCHTSAQVETLDPTSPSSATDALLRLKVAGVTTVLPYVSSSSLARVLMPAADQDGFHPEWVLTGVDAASDESTWSSAPAQQVRALFGLAGWQPGAGRRSSPAAAAAQGQPVDDAVYHALLVVASGVQAAGPELTPDAFATGLAGLTFPNPGAGARPIYQASVGFDDLDHAMVNDVALAWWNPGASRFCLAGGGTRWPFTALPGNNPGLFDAKQGC